MHQDIERVLISEQELAARIAELGKQVAADVEQHLLRGLDHDLGVAVGGEHADDIDGHRHRHACPLYTYDAADAEDMI